MDCLNDWIHQWVGSLGWTGEALVRLLLAAVLGGLVGIERELRGREAGFRTNLLVCVGSALAMLVSIRFADHAWPTGTGYNVNVDPARIAYGIMTGVGFLGAGAILKYESTIRGLTTAAALWCVAAIGLAAGFGLYVLATAAAGLVVAALWLLDMLESALPRRRFRKLVIRRAWNEQFAEELVKRFGEAGVRVEDHGYRRVGQTEEVDVELHVSYTDVERYEAAERALHADGSCRVIASERS